MAEVVVNQPFLGSKPRECPPLSSQEASDMLSGRSEPRVMRGMVESWPAWGKWSFEWFLEHYGSLELPVEWLKYASGSTRARRIGHLERMTLAEYLRRTQQRQSADPGYIIGHDLFSAAPELFEDVVFPRYHSFDSLVDHISFMGGAGVYTQLHYDRAHNLHAMLEGAKRWQMYAPERSAELKPFKYAFPWSVGSHLDVVSDASFSHSDISSPGKLPGGLEPDFDFLLEKGDVLVIPYGWWHRVLTVEPSIAVNYWWWDGYLLRRFGLGLVPEILKYRMDTMRAKQVRRGYRDE